MTTIARRIALLGIVTAPLFLFADSSTRWIDILASPFTSPWLAGFVAFAGCLGYSATGAFKRINWRGLVAAWAVILFIGLSGMYGVPLSDDADYDIPEPVPGALEGKDKLLRNYVWYMGAVMAGLSIGALLRRAKFEI